MIRHRSQIRDGYTILELMVVMVIILIIGAIVGPSLLGFWSNNRTKAAVDTVTARMADARGAAIGQGRAYKVCVSPDGTQVRVCPDESEPSEQLTTEQPASEVWQQDPLPKGVVVTPMTISSTAAGTSADGWTTLVVFQPDGTCLEDGQFELSEPAAPDVTPMQVYVRAMTGVWTVNAANTANAANPMGGTTMSGMQP